MDNHLKDITSTARECLLKTGIHYPQLFIFTTTGNTTLLFADFPEEYEKKVEAFIGAGIKVAKDKDMGEIEEVYFITEGWTGTLEEMNKTGKRPSEQLGRKEVLIVTGKIMKEKKSIHSICQTIRDTKDKIVEVRELPSPEEASVRSPFLEAFLFSHALSRYKVKQVQN